LVPDPVNLARIQILLRGMGEAHDTR